MFLYLFFALENPRWWDYPGFELWKFVNLAIFVIVLVVAMRKLGVSQMLRHRKESIKAELEKARTERDAALAKLKEVEERLASLDSQAATIKERSIIEAQEEGERIARSTEQETAKLTAQAQREIENAASAARKDLRRFTAEQSVRLAEEMIKRDIRPDDDARLFTRSIEEMGAAR
jgi:F-type H+-transporting ATPase subunit b